MTDRAPAPSPPAVRACPKCGQEVGGRPARCLYCGARLSAAPVRHRICPRCFAPMVEVAVSWVYIDRCEKCRGQYFDAGELEDLQRMDERARQWVADQEAPRPCDSANGHSLDCPGCGAPMQTFFLAAAKLLVDNCGRCKGTWLDAGEIDRLARALEKRTEELATPIACLEGEPAVAMEKSEYVWSIAAVALAIAEFLL
ncbi:MAG: zf-TFIIB domain-containing protein [Candidatus Wallbacteria bacterium]|nr:zf-TFIIB domain-containing protein [Candidatus Wallbacteria bacterium]